MELTHERLLDVYREGKPKPLSLRNVLARLGAPSSHRRLVLNMLGELADQGRLVRLRGKTFSLPAEAGRASGRIHISDKGTGFLLGADENGEDLYIHRSNTAGALDGDRVEAEVFDGPRGKEGRVTRILERAHEYIVGQFARRGKGGVVTPRNARIGLWVDIPDAPPPGELADGTWVRAHVTEWPQGPRDQREHLVGAVEETLGRPGERGLSVLLLLRDMGVEVDYPDDAVREAEDLKAPAEPEELARRLDLRDRAIVTIDPATAKDFDDALSIETIDNGRRRLGVHIADVAQYIRPGTRLDEEAYERATSIYPVDRVVPMLPERLSNDLCSLRPRENRYALSVFMDIDAHGKVHDYKLAESVICSRHRLTYEQVQEFFENPDRRKDFAFADVGDDLLQLRELARILNGMRVDRGALDLDLPEPEVRCNPEGDVLEITRHERFESHRLVEECMLIANEVVATHLKEKGLPCLYRVHDIPDPTGLEKIAPALALFGVKVPRRPDPTPATYQPLVDALHRADGGHIGQRMLLRTLTRAEYNPENHGHFGLASKCYCHFTSPIRRYPDLVVHRVVKHWLQSESIDADWRERLNKALPDMADQSNLMAERSERIERDAVQIKSMEFMADQLGNVYEGWISGITRNGMFVELIEMPVEGYVQARTLPGDQYRADENNTRMIGRHTNRRFRLGQRLRVRVVRVSVAEGEMDLEVVETAARSGGRKSKGRRSKIHRG